MQRLRVEALRLRRQQQRRTSRSEHSYAMSPGREPACQIQCLPLTAPHLATGVDMQDLQDCLRGLMFFAFAYFKKLYRAAM